MIPQLGDRVALPHAMPNLQYLSKRFQWLSLCPCCTATRTCCNALQQVRARHGGLLRHADGWVMQSEIVG